MKIKTVYTLEEAEAECSRFVNLLNKELESKEQNQRKIEELHNAVQDAQKQRAELDPNSRASLGRSLRPDVDEGNSDVKKPASSVEYSDYELAREMRKQQ